jgi:hypothetical protein
MDSALATNLYFKFLAKAASVLWLQIPSLKVGVSHTSTLKKSNTIWKRKSPLFPKYSF